LEIPVVVVARDALGTINHTLLTVEYARSQGIHVLGVIINTLSATPDPSTRTNAQVIKRLSGVSLLGVVPYLVTPERHDFSSIAKHVGEHVDTALLSRYERC
jgi:dethiobiotin synthetase